ncbi:hypothetical protein MMC31_002705 [Peltigera leucophlebia]|nr:hypothetical protein [Peltigera leucophlebia]
MSPLLPRDYWCDSDGYCHRSNWDSYGRWIVLVGVIIFGIFIFFIFACITARRRRAAGSVPYRGTGWAGGRPHAGQPQYDASQPQPYYAGNQYPQSPPPNVAPPVYVPPNQGYYGGDQNHGYFGGQQTGVELQTPDHSYQPQTGGQPVYNPPAGPPPGKA